MSEFFAMGGYAPYVWGSFGAFAVIVVWNLLAPRLARTGVMRQLTAEDDGGGERE
jgi:heme exporter protein D